jgi:hypothetical protein
LSVSGLRGTSHAAIIVTRAGINEPFSLYGGAPGAAALEQAAVSSAAAGRTVTSRHFMDEHPVAALV